MTSERSSTPSRRKRIKAIPPPDDPLGRSQEHEVARLVGEEPVDRIEIAEGGRALVTASARALFAVRRPPRRRVEDPRLELARRRIAALAQAKPIAGDAPPQGAGPMAMAPVAGASNWIQLGPTAIPNGQTYSSARVLVTGRVTAIAVDPQDRNTIYVATAQGGVWKSTDRGDHWFPMSDNEASLAIGALTIDPNDHNTIYAGTGEANFSLDSYYGAGILRSTNGGASWTRIGVTELTGRRIGRIAVTPGAPARLFAATSAGILRSTDGGATWSRPGNAPLTGQATDLTIDSANPGTVVAAVWGDGIYRTTNGATSSPTWTKLAGGLPASGFTRIALGRSPSDPSVIIALLSGPWDPDPNLAYLINGLYRSSDGGSTWASIPLPGGNLKGQGFYNLAVAVDPTTPDIVYLSAVSLWRAIRNPATGAWTITDVGGGFHPDNHALAFDPTDSQLIYAGSDGGIYRSTDRGTTWHDDINRDFCITQFEFIDDHPSTPALILGGTQDNGTEQYRNSPVFYHSDDGDGGFCAIDQSSPTTQLGTYYFNSPKRSTAVGAYLSWIDTSAGIAGPGLFYPPLTSDRTNPQNVAFGTDRLNLDPAQGTSGWPTKVTLPGLAANESVSAIHYLDSSLIYAGTTQGRVYRVTFAAGAWTATAVSAAPLPQRYIWDIGSAPGDPNTVFLVMSGFGTDHVWRGQVGGATPTWTSASGSGASRLPDIPANALVIDPAAPTTMYVATDVAVFRTTDGGTTWTGFSEGLPNCAVFDLRLHGPSRLLRAATHGRGIWERDVDAASAPDVRLFVRDNILDPGRGSSPSGVPAAFPDPRNGIAVGDNLYWWQCADIKVDALEGAPPSYQFGPGQVDYVRFESELVHRNPQRGRTNRVHVQVHNQGISSATSVRVKVLYANASAGLPSLPPDFWTAFPGDSINTSVWHPIGSAQTIPVVSSSVPETLVWDWTTPSTAPDHTCLLVVTEQSGDPIPAANQLLDVNLLVQRERRVGLRNVHVVDVPPGTTFWSELELHGGARTQRLRFDARLKGWQVLVILPKDVRDPQVLGLARWTPNQSDIERIRAQLGGAAERYDVARAFATGRQRERVAIDGLDPGKRGTSIVIGLRAPDRAQRRPQLLTVIQEDAKGIVGGSTYVVATSPKGRGS